MSEKIPRQSYKKPKRLTPRKNNQQTKFEENHITDQKNPKNRKKKAKNQEHTYLGSQRLTRTKNGKRLTKTRIKKKQQKKGSSSVFPRELNGKKKKKPRNSESITTTTTTKKSPIVRKTKKKKVNNFQNKRKSKTLKPNYSSHQNKKVQNRTKSNFQTNQKSKKNTGNLRLYPKPNNLKNKKTPRKQINTQTRLFPRNTKGNQKRLKANPNRTIKKQQNQQLKNKENTQPDKLKLVFVFNSDKPKKKTQKELSIDTYKIKTFFRSKKNTNEEKEPKKKTTPKPTTKTKEKTNNKSTYKPKSKSNPRIRKTPHTNPRIRNKPNDKPHKRKTPRPRPIPRTRTKTRTGTKTRPKPKPKTKAITKTKEKTNYIFKFTDKPKPKTNPRIRQTPHTKPRPRPRPRPRSRPKTRTKVRTGTKTRTKPKPTTTTKTKEKTNYRFKFTDKPKPKTNPRIRKTPNTKPRPRTTPNTKPQPRTKVITRPKPKPKPKPTKTTKTKEKTNYIFKFTDKPKPKKNPRIRKTPNTKPRPRTTPNNNPIPIPRTKKKTKSKHKPKTNSKARSKNTKKNKKKRKKQSGESNKIETFRKRSGTLLQKTVLDRFKTNSKPKESETIERDTGPYSNRKVIEDLNKNPTQEEEDEIKRMSNSPLVSELNIQEQNLVWRYRNYVFRHSGYLPILLKSVNYEDPDEVQEIKGILKGIRKIGVVVALELLSCKYKDQRFLRTFAVKRLKSLSNEELLLYLLQIVQVLRYEQNEKGELANYLIARALKNPLVGNYLYWYVGSERNDLEYPIFGRIHLEFAKRALESEPKLLSDLRAQDDLIYQLKSLSEKCKSQNSFVENNINNDNNEKKKKKKKKKKEKEKEEKNENEKEKEKEGKGEEEEKEEKVGEAKEKKRKKRRRRKKKKKKKLKKNMNIEKIMIIKKKKKKRIDCIKELKVLIKTKKYRKSLTFKKPISLFLDPKIKISKIDTKNVHIFKSAMMPIKFNFITANKKNYPILFKSGDDLRQDQLISQMISIMDDILKKNNLDLELITYKILAINPNLGFVQIIESNSIYSIIQENNGKIQDYFKKIEPDKSTYYGFSSRLMNNYIRSCDIDFGFILGHDPKPFPPPMKLCKEMIVLMGGMKSQEFQMFKILCGSAFKILRQHASLFVNLFALMIESNIPDLEKDPLNSILKMQRKFRLDLDEKEAIETIYDIIEESVHSLFPVVVDQLHSWAQYWRS
ncbi:phosphatidylinositol 3-kinase catalytic subunit type [Anaeramoeba flamelloides]|uniref:Phosphatidylinositol 3-kinase catalytic subunit type n=1 Tax=Anaeramoeba flamelloides TaxID=1746091 RepID=A0AAV7Y4L8_9EUKA|nr:phosphatidylinositol 3-kinase catalytic subunit type [Anaeramoeba flamelloides]